MSYESLRKSTTEPPLLSLLASGIRCIQFYGQNMVETRGAMGTERSTRTLQKRIAPDGGRDVSPWSCSNGQGDQPRV
ncbi:hypothetical protein CHS0354_027518 [Potamilus streckersoni]|uniref:Uncharacterized protein n=1 Tax=Potamilus streckersoni TaxID=2493646 RepID=A0AAE0S4R1_9BIVA|nr:hypothetical protein CHS0354_027518 [Potamilus streckersoni]